MKTRAYAQCPPMSKLNRLQTVRLTILLLLVTAILVVAFLPAPVLAAMNRAVDWTQCRNDNGGGIPISGGSGNDGVMDPCNWVNGSLGDSNSIYTEGDVVPQRALQSVPDAGAHYVTFDHSFYDSAKGAYTYDLWATPSFTLRDDGSTNHLNLTPCNDLPTSGTNFGDNSYNNCLLLYNNKVSYAIPSEASYTVGGNNYTYPHVAGAEANALADGATRNLWISCGQVTGTGTISVTPATQCTGVTITILGHGDHNSALLPGAQQQGPPSSDDYVQMKVQFTTPLANQFVFIWTGGHLAKASYWNDASFGSFQKLGAASAAGASFHERLIGWDAGSSIGNQDNQVQAGAVVSPGSLTVVKDDLTNSSTAFPFTANAPLSPASFSLCDPAFGGCLPSITYSALPSGAYTISENNPGLLGYVLTSHTCVNNTGTSSFSYTVFGATIALQPGSTVTCTFTNNTPPLAAYLGTFKANPQPNFARLNWKTVNEMSVIGFNIWRSRTRDGTYTKINTSPIYALHTGQLVGDKYTFRDTGVKAGRTYYYKIELLGPSGTLEWSGIKRVPIP